MAITGFKGNRHDFGNMFGDGGQGSATISTDQTMGGLNYYSDFTLESGTTLTVSDTEPLIIVATGTITINGIIEGDGRGANGGTANSNGNDRKIWKGIQGGNGGDGGDSADGQIGQTGGVGGSDTYTTTEYDLMNPIFKPSPHTPLPLNEFINGNLTIGGFGGAGGGDGAEAQDVPNGGSGSGGKGGDGGAGVWLMAPQVDITGTLNLRGLDGQDGGDTSYYESDTGQDRTGGAGGGGGGGTGGQLLVYTYSYNNSGTLNMSGGAKGLGGIVTTGSGETTSAEDGTNGTVGDNGQVILVTP